MRTELTGLLLVCWMVLPVAAQSRKGPGRAAPKDSPLCVDVVSFRQGKPARGLIVPQRHPAQADSVLMLVEREELQRDNPNLYAKAARSEAEVAKAAWAQLKERLEKELAVNDLAMPLKSLFERELAKANSKLESFPKEPELQTRLMWLEFHSPEASQLRRALPEAQRVAIWAWSEKLVDVTRRPRSELEGELADVGVQVSLKPPDLSKQLSPRLQSEDEWAFRLALVRYTFDKGLDFQGSQGIYLRSGGQLQAGDIQALVQKMMSGNLEQLMQDLDPAAKAQARQAKENWYQSVVSQVEAAGRGEFRITRLDLDPDGQVATVETALVARLPSRGWQIIWSSQQAMRADQVNAPAEQQIADDPQIKSALSLLSAFGVNAQAEVQKALRFGAATQAAQKLADAAFLEMRDSYVQRLDGPPL